MTDYDDLEADPGNRRLLRQEELLVEAGEELSLFMMYRALTVSELATKAREVNLRRILAGEVDIPLRQWADLAGALDCRVALRFVGDLPGDLHGLETPSAQGIGLAIQRDCRCAGLKPDQLAERSGVSLGQVKKLMAGEHAPGRKTLEKLRTALAAAEKEEP